MTTAVTITAITSVVAAVIAFIVTVTAISAIPIRTNNNYRAWHLTNDDHFVALAMPKASSITIIGVFTAVVIIALTIVPALVITSVSVIVLLITIVVAIWITVIAAILCWSTCSHQDQSKCRERNKLFHHH